MSEQTRIAMKTYTYLSLIPEALILSQLPPTEFGNYLAVGTRKHASGQAVFFEVDPDFKSNVFPLQEARRRCTPHEDGTLRRSTYVSIYKVLENVPLEVIGAMYLTTSDGRVLRIEARPFSEKESAQSLHLYQELCPVHTMVASRCSPREFGEVLTQADELVRLPRVAYCELNLGELAQDPANGDASNLPYPQMDHLRDCLTGLQSGSQKQNKIVFRNLPPGIMFRTVTSGFFLADPSGLLFYPMPSRQELETKHYSWWKSARMSFSS